MMSTGVPRPRVLMITGAYAPEISGGGLQCKGLIGVLRSAADFIVLTTCTAPGLARCERVDGVEVYRVFVDVKHPRSMLGAAMQFAWRLLALRSSFDLVHLHGFSRKSALAILAARVLRRPLVLTIHTAVHDEPAGVRAQGRLARWAYAQAATYLAVSPGIQRAVVDAGLPAARVRCVPNGVDLRRFRPPAAGERESLRVRLGLPGGQRLILFVGFFSIDKGPHVLFDAWRRLGPTRAGTSLVFVGATESAYYEVDGGLADRIRAEAARDGLDASVIFAGERADVDAYYRACDVFVLPSRREAFGMALAEAMASRLPCIASRLPGVTDAIVVDEASGLLVPPHDIDALTRALARVLDDKPLAQRLGVAARARVEALFDVERVAAQTLDVYRELHD